MKPSLITVNKWLLRFCVVLILAGVPIFFLPYMQIFFYKPKDLVLEFNVATADSFDIAPDISRNIFDPTGQIWQASIIRKAKGKGGAGGAQVAGEINGLIDMPGTQGVMAGGKFIPIGGAVAGGNLESVDGGRIKINTSQGIKEIDINQNRNQQRQSLNIQIR